MNDKDRGTYSPPTEDNLSYETRKTQKRDQAPITLIISGICLVLLLLAVVLFYNSGLNNHGRTPPDVGDTVGDIKDGKVEDAKPLTDQEMNDGTGDATSAHFAPGAEAPGDRGDDASVAAVDQAPPPVTPIQGPLPSQANNAAIPGTAAAGASASKSSSSLALKGAMPSTASEASASKPAQVAAIKPQPSKPDVTKPDATKSDITKPDATKAVALTKPAPVAAGAATVQIGAFESQDIANKQYSSIASSYGLFLNGTGKHIEKVDTDKGTFFRTSVTGFATPDKAKAFCSALKAAGHDCFVK